MDNVTPFSLSTHSPAELPKVYTFNSAAYTQLVYENKNLTSLNVDPRLPPTLHRKYYCNQPPGGSSSQATGSSLISFMSANGYTGSYPKHLGVYDSDKAHRISNCSSFSSNRSTYGSSGELPSDISSFDSHVYRGVCDEKPKNTNKTGEYVFMETLEAQTDKYDYRLSGYKPGTSVVRNAHKQHEYVFIDSVDPRDPKVTDPSHMCTSSNESTRKRTEKCEVHAGAQFAGVHKVSFNKYKRKLSSVKKPPKLSIPDLDFTKYQLPVPSSYFTP